MTRVHLTRRALLDLDENNRYSVEHWGETVAEQYIRDHDSGLARLEESPSLLRERPDHPLRLRFYRVRQQVLICDVVGERIHVLAVRHTSMDLPQRLAELEPQLIYEAELLHHKIVAKQQ